MNAGPLPDTAVTASMNFSGSDMTLPMDIRMMSTTAKIGFVFNKRGILPEAASSWFLPRIVGIQQALEWVYSGDILDAQEALRGKQVKTVVAPSPLKVCVNVLARLKGLAKSSHLPAARSVANVPDVWSSTAM